MCICNPIIKGIREASGSDALWFVSSTTYPAYTAGATHAIGPASSLTSCVMLLSAMPDQLGALVDRNGYITQLFTIPGGFGLITTPQLSAWNGSSRAWFWTDCVLGGTYAAVYAYNTSGTLILNTTASSVPRNRFAVCCNSSGRLVFVSGTSLQIRNDTFGLVASAFSPNATTYSYGDTVCVDSSDNVFVTTTTYIRKYDSSLSPLWTVSLPMLHLACVADSSGAVYVFSNDSGAGKIRKYNSSGTLQWTVTLSGAFDSAASNGRFDVWCDGTNIYFIGTLDSSFVRLKYDGSGTLAWSETVWWQADNLSVGRMTMRGDGSVLALGGFEIPI